jgi:hypothetical protein
VAGEQLRDHVLKLEQAWNDACSEAEDCISCIGKEQRKHTQSKKNCPLNEGTGNDSELLKDEVDRLAKLEKALESEVQISADAEQFSEHLDVCTACRRRPEPGSFTCSTWND